MRMFESKTYRRMLMWLFLSGCLITVFGSCKAGNPKSLPSFNVDLQETSVSGLSSGGYMAVQFEIAYSSIIKGAGVIAGGPYFCAQNNIGRAMSICSCANPLSCDLSPGATDVRRLVQITRGNAEVGEIDAASYISSHKVFLLSGTDDKVVPQAIMNDLESYYRNFVPESSIQYKKDIPTGHSFPTDLYGNACNHVGEPFINNCGYDTSGELLKHIYGNLKPRNTGRLSGTLVEFDQEEFIDEPESHSMDTSGWIYVPESCRAGQRCRIHIAFHGCLQGQRTIGRQFIEHAGYNQWADSNNILVLYPQVIAKSYFGVPGSVIADPNNTNPRGCWNWWGYDKDEKYACKSGHQMAAVKAMIDRIAGEYGGAAVAE